MIMDVIWVGRAAMEIFPETAQDVFSSELCLHSSQEEREVQHCS
jgi:hypothetical protein